MPTERHFPKDNPMAALQVGKTFLRSQRYDRQILAYAEEILILAEIKKDVGRDADMRRRADVETKIAVKLQYR